MVGLGIAVFIFILVYTYLLPYVALIGLWYLVFVPMVVSWDRFPLGFLICSYIVTIALYILLLPILSHSHFVFYTEKILWALFLYPAQNIVTKMKSPHMTDPAYIAASYVEASISFVTRYRVMPEIIVLPIVARLLVYEVLYLLAVWWLSPRITIPTDGRDISDAQVERAVYKPSEGLPSVLSSEVKARKMNALTNRLQAEIEFLEAARQYKRLRG